MSTSLKTPRNSSLIIFANQTAVANKSCGELGDGLVLAHTLGQHLDARVRTHHKFRTAVLILNSGQKIDIAVGNAINESGAFSNMMLLRCHAKM